MTATGVGKELKRERERQGLSKEEIIRRTRLSPRSVDALEADDFDSLPGIVFARSFVRLYALDLGMDADALLARLPQPDIEAMPLPNPPARLGGKQKRDPRVTAALSSALWLIIASTAGAGLWYYANHSDTLRLELFRHTAAAVVHAAPPVSAAINHPQSPAQVQPAETAALQENPLTETSVVSPDPSRPVQVILTAREAAWVQISADGHSAFAGMLQPHDQRAIAADAQVRIMTGNAGGIDISLNGRMLDPIGPSGQTRTVSLTAEGPQPAPQTQMAASSSPL